MMRRMRIFGKLQLWVDPVARSGPEAMAVDEWLLETARTAVLRVYGWDGAWGSLGYFGKIAEARERLPGVDWVRRWTGGGVVDHRDDWTYTLVAPATGPLAGLRGAESYRLPHSALAATLRQEGISATLAGDEPGNGAALCFQNPVTHDLLAAGGAKLAGAGQRRTRTGLLHQGSVTGGLAAAESVARAEAFADRLADGWRTVDFSPPSEEISRLVADRYDDVAWTARR